MGTFHHRTIYTFYILIALSTGISSCTKSTENQSPKKEYIQHFKANIAGKDVLIENSINSERNKLQGQITGLFDNNGIERKVYTVNVKLPTATDSQLKFQIENIAAGKFNITGVNSYYPAYKTYIRLTNKDEQSTAFVANINKKPFEIEITRYEYIEGSMVPIVGGKLNGVLYNEKNIQDSVVIKNGSFEVRF